MTLKKHPQEGTHTVRSVLPVSRSLIDAVLGAPPLKRKPPKPPSSGAGNGHGSKARKYPDEVILEIRRLREFEGVRASGIVDALAKKGIEVSASYVHACVQYLASGALVPDKDHSPYI